MNKVHTAVYALLMLITLASCKKENDIIKNDDDARMYQLPQGNEPYDQQIMEFYKKYNSVILYKYNQADFTYNFTGLTEVNISAPAAGPNGIQETIDFLQQQLISKYPEEFLQKNLPFKILLASKILKKRESFPFDTLELPAAAGYSNITFGLTGRLSGLSHETADSARGGLHGALWLKGLLSGNIKVPPTFTPANTGYSPDPNHMRDMGFFFYRLGGTEYQDVADYITVITGHHKTWLDANVFTPSFDPKGNFKRKYNLVINYYKTQYNVDLQAIGNL